MTNELSYQWLKNGLPKWAWSLSLAACLFISGLCSRSAPVALAYDPHFRLPWAEGAQYGISGYSYNTPPTHIATYNDYYAIDFGVGAWQEVHAAQGGYATVNDLGTASYGKYITINHGNGFVTLYAHLNAWVSSIPNTNVTQGQLIGWAGSTGNSSGPHLHFSARYNNTSYMPEPMSGYTGFGLYGSGRGTSPNYINNPQLSNVLKNGDTWTYPVMSDNGGGPWVRSAYSNYAVYCCGPDGNNFLEMNTGVFGSASIQEDFPLYNDWSGANYTSPHTFISTPDTWTVRARIRSSCGSAAGTIAVWALDGSDSEAGSTPFTATGVWQWFTATTHFTRDGHARLRAIIYMDSANCNYDFDNVTLQRNYINNSSFEDSTQYWAQRYPGNCQSYWAVYPSGAFDKFFKKLVNAS